MIRYINAVILFLMFFSFASANNQEFRSTWVITWEHSNSSDNVESSKARIRKILDNHKKANMNAVLWQVRQGGTAYYNSSYEPWGSYSNGPYPGDYDILQYAIEQAHERGMELHAWFNAFHTSSTLPGTPVGEHPEWICRDSNGNPMPGSYALSPGLKEVRDYTLKVAMEIVRNYDIDGLHLDYVRWNEYKTSNVKTELAKNPSKAQQLDGYISPEALSALESASITERYLYDVEHPYSAGVPSGYDSWEDWWRWSVTEFVKTLHDSVQSVKSWVRLSPAALGKYRWSSWQGYGTVYQDAALWFNEGYIDQLVPMHYHWTTGSEFYGMLQADGQESWGYWIQPGIEAGRLFSVGPYSSQLSDDGLWENHEDIINRSRDVNWVDGFQFFSYGAWASNQYWEDAAERFFTGKTKMRAAKFLYDEQPESPSLMLTKLDSLKYQLDVEPPSGLEKDQWFAVYRSENEQANPSSDRIVDIHFGKSAYTIVDTYSGVQDFNGRYTYYSTMLDRFWNESLPSGTETTDGVPSAAPLVLSVSPAAGDSLAVNDQLTVVFSKTMDITSFESNIQVDQGMELNPLSWSADQKSVILSFTENLAYNTAYILTISDQVTDINGRRLDGNGDGGEGESFVFPFHTMMLDNQPPSVNFSSIGMTSPTENLDTEDVLTFGFDELLDHSLLNEEDIRLFKQENLVPSRFKLNDIQGRTIISIQPEEAFGSLVDYSVELGQSLTDTAGNAIEEDIQAVFRTEPFAYDQKKMIDEFYTDNEAWWDPEGSGSTMGTIGAATTFGYSTSYYLPSVSRPYKKRSAQLKYEWDPSESSYLLRTHCAGSGPLGVSFDTTYTLQCYVFGDGSGNRFRFSLTEKNGQGYPLEVSKWETIDWVGWKLLEWDLGDPEAVGTWLGNEILDGSSYVIESLQMGHPEGSAIRGALYFSNLRVVKKKSFITRIEDGQPVPKQYALSQNYPNPFNPSTKINFELGQAGHTSLTIYDLLGRKIKTLVNEYMEAGKYTASFRATNLASGVYVYELRAKNINLRKRMVLVK